MGQSGIEATRGFGGILNPLGRAGVWLDAWAVHNYAHDTRAWDAKMEKLKSLDARRRESVRPESSPPQ